MRSVLAEGFRHVGPLYEFNSPSEYLASLTGNLEPDPDAEVLASLGDNDRAAVFYTYHGNTIGQLFRCAKGLVHETILVFDTNKVA